MNFIGAAQEFFDEINGTFEDSTKDAYTYNYNEHIFPMVNPALPMDDYCQDVIKELMNRIKMTFNLDQSTMDSRIRHLVIDPVEMYFSKKPAGNDCNRFWGAYWHFSAGEDLNNALLILKKSFTKKEQDRLSVLLNKPEAPGEYAGLSTMAHLGVRNNEACGLNYGDFFQLRKYREIKCARIFTTTSRQSNVLKEGTKTINGVRILPSLYEKYDRFVDLRMQFISETARFPLKDKNGNIYRNILQLPVVCKGYEFQERCRSNDLSEVGSMFLKNEMRINENRMAGINMIIQTHDSGEDVIEADATTYLFRRNLATQLYLHNFSEVERNYYMGHKLDDERYRHSDFTDDDYLYAMWKKFNPER